MMPTQSVALYSPAMTTVRAQSLFDWSQKWLHIPRVAVSFCLPARYEPFRSMPWAQGVAGSNP